jgi:O-antigen ligase
MTARTARWWVLLAGSAAALWATLNGSSLAEGAAGAFCLLLVLFLVRLDGQRKRGRTRR